MTSKSIYLDWDNCPFHTGSDYETGWTKYIPSSYTLYWSGAGNPDNKTVLNPEDDVAHVKLGGKWRMPTRDEIDELKNNCTSEWTTLNGVAGRKFTSKKVGILLRATPVPFAPLRAVHYKPLQEVHSIRYSQLLIISSVTVSHF